MNKKNARLLAIALVVLLVSSGIAAYFLLTNGNDPPPSTAIRVACVGDSLTQSTEYPYDLWKILGMEHYSLRNYGAGSTTVSLDSETPYMNTSMFQDALDFQPDIVIIMLGTNDAQPSLHQFNASFVGDYVQLVTAFQGLSSKPEIWVVLPPPIFSDQGGKMDPEYFSLTIIPGIEQAATETNSPIIDVYSALINYPQYSTDGVHINSDGAQIIADEVYTAIFS
jgi:lysophospholipase L1-like esterase